MSERKYRKRGGYAEKRNSEDKQIKRLGGKPPKKAHSTCTKQGDWNIRPINGITQLYDPPGAGKYLTCVFEDNRDL